MSLDIVILAAGQGRRMCSSYPKVLHKIAGKEMLSYVVETARKLNPTTIYIVVGKEYKMICDKFIDKDVIFIKQPEQLGTGNALAQVIPFIKSKNILILYGDVPFIKRNTLKKLVSNINESQIAILTSILLDSTDYGIIIRDSHNNVCKIIEYKDANIEERKIKEINTGILALPIAPLRSWIPMLSNNNKSNEYYLTDLISLAVHDNFKVKTVHPTNILEAQGVNNRVQQAKLERYYQKQQAIILMRKGVTLIDPERIYIRGHINVGRDIIIDVNVILEGLVIIEDNVNIGPNCLIKNSTLRTKVVIKANSTLEGVEMGEGSNAGPFAQLRPGTVLSDNVHIGSFVEIKNTKIGKGSKAGHLSYLGDTHLGENCNIGAGTITCNYDGCNKLHTEIGDNVFIGSNNSLVAPLKIGNNSTTGAGSIITQEVPSNNLSLSRPKQKNIDNWIRNKKNK